MAILHIEGFDILGADDEVVTSVMTAGEYLDATSVRVVNTPVRTVTSGLPSFASKLTPANNSFFRWRHTADVSTLITGYGLYKVGSAASGILCDFQYNTGVQHNIQLSISRDSNNSIVLKNGAGTTLATSAVLEFQFGTWQYIELKATAGVSTGTAVVRLNEKELINVTSVMTVASAGATTQYNQIRFEHGGFSLSEHSYVDDLYVADDSGASNNDFLGQISCYTLPANANGSTNQWTVSGAAALWSAVSDSPKHDSDTTYVTASTVGFEQFFHVKELPDTVTDVFAVKNVMMGRKQIAGSNSIELPIRVAGSQTSGVVTHTVDVTYGFDGDIFESVPGGGGWTTAAVSALQVGVVIVSTA